MIARGTIAIIGTSHIGSSKGRENFLREELNDNIEKIIIKIKMLIKRFKVPKIFSGKIALSKTCATIKINGPAIK